MLMFLLLSRGRKVEGKHADASPSRCRKGFEQHKALFLSSFRKMMAQWMATWKCFQCHVSQEGILNGI